MADGYETSYDAYQAGQATALENLLRGLNVQQQRTNMAGQNLAGNAIMAPSAPSAAPPVLPTPPVTSPPVPGAPPPAVPGAPPQMGPMPAPPAPPAGGAPASMPAPGPSATGQGAAPPPAQQQQPWWKVMAAQIKQQNPDVSGRQVMAAINAMEPVMNSQNRQQLADLRIQMALQKLQSGQGTPEEIQFLADEVKNGNQAMLVRMPAPVRLAVMDKLEKSGVTGGDAAAAATTYKGKQSEASAAGRQTGGIDVATEGFKAIAPKALEASREVPRGSWKFANQVTNWLKEQSNDPAFAKFQNFNLGLVREYARAMGGTVSAQNKAEGALGTAKSPEAYSAAVESLLQEVTLAQQGGKKAIASAGDKNSQILSLFDNETIDKENSSGSPPQGAKQAPDGKWYLPDPNRPGKYLQWQP